MKTSGKTKMAEKTVKKAKATEAAEVIEEVEDITSDSDEWW